MNTIDLTPLYRNTIGFDRFGALLDTALRSEQTLAGYPPYNIEVTGENAYTIALAVSGYSEEELDIQVENSVLSIRGKISESGDDHQYLYQGIAARTFERKFNLADHVEVTSAKLNNGLLTINLIKEVPEEMKPKHIPISSANKILEVKSDTGKAA